MVGSQFRRNQKLTFGTYVDSLTRKFDGGDEDKRLKLLRGLDLLCYGNLESIETRNPDLGELRSSNSELEQFDGGEAKRIRLDAELSITGLARILVGEEGNIPSVRNMLGIYERGKSDPRLPLSTIPKKYLTWLANNGYNPYCLNINL